MYRIPHQLQIDSSIIMDEKIAHSYYLLPREIYVLHFD